MSVFKNIFSCSAKANDEDCENKFEMMRIKDHIEELGKILDRVDMKMDLLEKDIERIKNKMEILKK